MRQHQRLVFVAAVLCSAPSQAQLSPDVASPSRDLLLPQTLRIAELHYQRSRFVVINRQATRSPGLGDHSVVLLDDHATIDFSPRLADALPESNSFNIRDAAVGADELLMAVDQVTKDGAHKNLIVAFDLKTHRLTRVIDTRSVACMEIAVDSASALWCLGNDTIAARPGSLDWPLLHRLGRDGLPTKSVLRRADLRPATPTYPLHDTGFGPTTLTAAGRYLFAWIAPLNTYVQVDARNGRVVRIVAVPQALRGIAFKEDGTAVIGQVGLQRSKTRLLEYDVFSNSWIENALSSHIPDGARVIGHDGSSFVLWDRRANRVVSWSDPKAWTTPGSR
jgi:hypothetical protein